LQCAVARASAEFCPASIVQMTPFQAPYAGLRSFSLLAESERTVSGTITIHTDKGWYAAPFTNVKISPDLAHYKDALIQYDRTLYHSKVLYLRLPPGEKTKEFWVSEAMSTEETTFGWDARGRVLCPDPAYGDSEVEPAPKRAPRVNDTQDFTQLPGSSDDVAVAVPAEEPAGYASCAKPFSSARVKHAVSPEWPQGIEITRNASTFVEIAISAEGKVVDAWIYQPSGLPELDFAALKAARLSEYQGGVSLCKPAPGTYIFTATFMR
jgi:hypothetical protein